MTINITYKNETEADDSPFWVAAWGRVGQGRDLWGPGSCWPRRTFPGAWPVTESETWPCVDWQIHKKKSNIQSESSYLIVLGYKTYTNQYIKGQKYIKHTLWESVCLCHISDLQSVTTKYINVLSLNLIIKEMLTI